MKKISEVCQITGVSRKALQQYEKMGLLKHTAETEGGYWLYDNDAIERIKIIVLFNKGMGVERKEIKKILDDPSPDNFIKELVNAIETLKERKKQIDGMIKFAKVLIMTSEDSFKYIKLIRSYSNFDAELQSTCNIVNEEVNLIQDFSEEAIEEYLRSNLYFFDIIDLQRNKSDKKKILKLVNEIYISYIHFSEENFDEKFEKNSIYTLECFNGFIETVNDYILPNMNIGTEGLESINEALDSFKESIKKGFWCSKK